MKRVLVTGLGFVTSIGNNKKSVEQSLKNLKHGIEKFKPFEKENIPVKVVGTIKDFETRSKDYEDWKAPNGELQNLRQNIRRSLAPHGFYAFYAMDQALKDAGLNKEDISNPKTGLYTASAGSTSLMYDNLKKMHERGVMRCPPLGIVSSIVGTLTYNLTAAYEILGSSTGFASACASSGHAIGYAFNEIKNGNQDRMIIVGGEDCRLETILPFSAMRVLSTNSDPDKAARPFDKHRSGFVGTGGSVVIIMEEESIAKKRNARVYSEVLGWGQATDGYHPAKPHPKGRGLSQAIKNALTSTKTNPSSINYINAHATGTYPGDLAELEALNEILGSSKKQTAISSTKALTGHGLSLASVMEAAFCNLNIFEKFIPGSANIEYLDDAAKDFNIIRESQEKEPKIILSNSSGFGGANVALLFKKYQ